MIGFTAMEYMPLYYAGREMADIKLFCGVSCEMKSARSSDISWLFLIIIKNYSTRVCWIWDPDDSYAPSASFNLVPRAFPI